MALNQAQLLSVQDLSAQEIRFLFQAARAFSSQLEKPQPLTLLKNYTIAHLFFEPSTRTRTSFEIAIRKLSGNVLNFSSSHSSLQKGETIVDTALNIQAMKVHCMVVRHRSSGSPLVVARQVKIPVVNAGDGFHEHPTQALLDAFTMEQKLGDLRNKKVVILGDIAHSRVARSNIIVLNKLGASVSVCGPPTLLPPHPSALQVKHAYRPEEVLEEADVVMALRIQLERHNQMHLPSLQEYSRFWGLNKQRAKLLKKNAIIMHPGPINRGIELDPELADGERSVILDQVTNGILIRMAVLSAVVNPKGLQQWLEEGKYV